MSLFVDRRHAGKVLATALEKLAGRSDLVILALPRGGLPVAYEVARHLEAPLDVFLVRKLGVPEYPELAMGAIASGGVMVINDDVVSSLGISNAEIDATARVEARELERRELAYRDRRAPTTVTGKTVILVDDGLATGSTMSAAIKALREKHPARVIAAVPVAAPETCSVMAEEADEMVCAMTPEPFIAVGVWYRDFSQTSDAEVRELLSAADRAYEERPAGHAPAS
jgi:putative phosphoribosyl transferase